MILIPTIVSNSMTSLYNTTTNTTATATITKTDTSTKKDYYSLPALIPITTTDDDSDSDNSTEYSVGRYSNSSSLIEQNQPVQSSALTDDSESSTKTKKSVRFNEDCLIHVHCNTDEPMTLVEKDLAFYNATEINIIRKQNKSLGRFVRHLDSTIFNALFQNNDNKGTSANHNDEDDHEDSDSECFICLRGLEKLLSNDTKMMSRMRRKRMTKSILEEQERQWLLLSAEMNHDNDDDNHHEKMNELLDQHTERLCQISMELSQGCRERAIQLASDDFQHVQQQQ
jgi:hypothetical protein